MPTALFSLTQLKSLCARCPFSEGAPVQGIHVRRLPLLPLQVLLQRISGHHHPSSDKQPHEPSELVRLPPWMILFGRDNRNRLHGLATFISGPQVPWLQLTQWHHSISAGKPDEPYNSVRTRVH